MDKRMQVDARPSDFLNRENRTAKPVLSRTKNMHFDGPSGDVPAITGPSEKRTDAGQVVKWSSDQVIR